jgi:hypothetical protein
MRKRVAADTQQVNENKKPQNPRGNPILKKTPKIFLFQIFVIYLHQKMNKPIQVRLLIVVQ